MLLKSDTEFWRYWYYFKSLCFPVLLSHKSSTLHNSDHRLYFVTHAVCTSRPNWKCSNTNNLIHIHLSLPPSSSISDSDRPPRITTLNIVLLCTNSSQTGRLTLCLLCCWLCWCCCFFIIIILFTFLLAQFKKIRIKKDNLSGLCLFEFIYKYNISFFVFGN